MMNNFGDTHFGDTEPSDAIAKFCEASDAVSAEAMPISEPAALAGRVFAESLKLDRDSPACDASAMDGFAVRHAELFAGPLPIAGECRIGQPPTTLPAGKAMRIYTGSPVPDGADTVVRLEWATEANGVIERHADREPRLGQDIRRRGENLAAGETILPAGQLLTTAAIATLASIGPASLSVYRKLKVAILTTGDEVTSHQDALAAGEDFPAHRLRNSNGPALAALAQRLSFVESVTHDHVADDPGALANALRSAIAEADAVVLTGGVSKGAHDYVRGAVEQVDGKVLFHGVMARPGRPTLGAVVSGTPVLGLPGNPVAVLATSRRLLVPVLRHRAGLKLADPPAPQVTLESWGKKSLPLAWWRPATMIEPGVVRLASLRGSGDVCGPATTDGFVEAPPHADHTGPFPFYSWQP